MANGGIAASGTGYDRTLTLTPLKEGSATITATVNDGSATASRSFTVTVRDPAAVASVDWPAAGYWGAGGHLDFTVHFSRNIQGGTGSVLPLTVGGYDAAASYLSATADSITYRYTLAGDDEGAVELGAEIDDSASPITDTGGYAAELTFTGGATGITAIPTPAITGDAAGDTAVYGTRVTFTFALTCADTLAGTVQFQSDGADVGSPVALSGNRASYQTAVTELDAGTPGVTGIFLPSGTNYCFTSLSSGTLTMTVTPKSVAVTGLTATPKDYDGSTAVALSGGELSGVLTGDTVTADCPTAGTAASAEAGTHSVSFTAVTLTGADMDNYTIGSQPSVSVVISPKALTFTAAAADKPYDGNTVGTVSGVTFSGLATGETLASGVDYTASAVFDSAEIGENIPVTVTVALLSTVKTANYTLSASTADTQADITKKPLSITGVAASDRAYDGDTGVALSGGALVGVESADAANVGFTLGSGTMANANAGSLKSVTTAIALTGSASDSYMLSQPGYVTVNISKAPLTLTSASAWDRGYDGTVTADVNDVTVDGAIPGETLTFNTDYTASGIFDSADIGDGKTVTVTVTLAATAVAANYTIPTNTITTTASISSSGLTIAGVAATDRAYDGTTSVALTGGTLSGVKPADTTDVGFALHTGTVADADAGDAKPVTTVITLTGSKAGNYTLTQPDGLTVDISKAALTITAADVASKPYDATTGATVNGVTFSGLASGETLAIGTDYTATGVFSGADAGPAVSVTVSAALGDTALANNYTVSGTYGASAAIERLALSGAAEIDVTNEPAIRS